MLVSFLRAAAVMLVALALIGPATASAEEQTTTPVTTTTVAPTTGTTPAPTTTTTTTTTSGAEKAEESEGAKKSETDDTWIAVAFILFAGFSVLALFWYLGFSQRNFFKAVSLIFRQSGVVPAAEPIPTVLRASLAETAVKIDIKGPGTFPVGEPVTFSATSNGSPIDVDWGIAPAESASPSSGSSSSSITFKASAQAVFTVTAKAAEGTGEAAVQATSTAPVPSRPSLPFVGENYGAALIAIVAVAGVVVLGLTDAIKGEAIATFFGALLGYAFGKGVQSSQSGTPTTSNPGSDTQE